MLFNAVVALDMLCFGNNPCFIPCIVMQAIDIDSRFVWQKQSTWFSQSSMHCARLTLSQNCSCLCQWRQGAVLAQSALDVCAAAHKHTRPVPTCSCKQRMGRIVTSPTIMSRPLRQHITPARLSQLWVTCTPMIKTFSMHSQFWLLLLTGGKVLPGHAKVHIVHAMQLPAVWWSGRIKTCLEHKVWCCIFS